MSESREFPNQFLDYAAERDEGANQAAAFEATLRENILKLLNNLEDGLESGTDWRDESVYTGTSGIALLYLHLSKVLGSEFSQDCIQKALPCVQHAVKHLKGHRVSFLCGDPGPLAICSVLYHKTGRQGQAQELLKKLQKMKDPVLSRSSDMPDELLYGRAGYLFALLFAQKHMGEACIEKSVIKNVAETILISGQELSKAEGHPCPLMYKWHDKHYLGAAHGLSGILYMLMQTQDYISPHYFEKLVRPTVDYMITLSFASGNFPSSLGNTSDKLVHWCHGAPGFIHTLLLAHKVFGGEKYLMAAVDCAEVIWKRGILKKGYGICHGTAGNGYAFLAIYQVTKDRKYLYRAQKFAQWCFDYGKHGCRIADRPLSLFEGLAGTIYFLADTLNPEKAAFPAYQLW